MWRRGVARGEAANANSVMIDMVAPIGLYAPRRCRMTARTQADDEDRAFAVRYRLGLRPSELEVHAGAERLDDEVRGTVERIGTACGVAMPPSALVVGKLANRYSSLNVQLSAQAYSQPTPTVQPKSDFEPVALPLPGGVAPST